MNNIRYLDGGFSVIENLKVSGAREGKYGVSIILCPNSTASAVFTSRTVEGCTCEDAVRRMGI